MTLDQVVNWIIVGGIVGLLPQAFLGGSQVGVLGTTVIGILGGLLGGWLFQMAGLQAGGGALSQTVAALIGAVLLLFVFNSLQLV